MAQTVKVNKFKIEIKDDREYHFFSKADLWNVVEVFNRNQDEIHAFSFPATKEQAKNDIHGVSIFCMVQDVLSIRLIEEDLS